MRQIAQREFAVDFLDRLAAEPQILNNLMISDEAHFQLWGGVNKQNFRYYASENSRELHEKPLHSECVTVWCAIASFGIISPYFFENHNDHAVTVTSDHYVNMVNTIPLPALANHNRPQIWFQTGWHNSSYSLSIHGCIAACFSRPSNFQIWRHQLASMVARSDYPLFLFMGISEEPSLHDTPSNIGRP